MKLRSVVNRFTAVGLDSFRVFMVLQVGVQVAGTAGTQLCIPKQLLATGNGYCCLVRRDTAWVSAKLLFLKRNISTCVNSIYAFVSVVLFPSLRNIHNACKDAVWRRVGIMIQIQKVKSPSIYIYTSSILFFCFSVLFHLWPDVNSSLR